LFQLTDKQQTSKKGGESKKKRLLPRKSGPAENGKKSRKNEDDEILSDDPDVEGVPGVGSDEGYPPSPEDNETAEEKRLRLAKKYLEEIQREGQLLILIKSTFLNAVELYCQLLNW
jgi:ribosomal RNA-processing protein 9